MDSVDKLRAVKRVGGREDTSWEQAQLHQTRDGLVLGRLGCPGREPGSALALQAGRYARHVLLLATLLVLRAKVLLCTHASDNEVKFI